MAQFPQADLAAAMKDPTKASLYNGYRCVETSDIWKYAFAPLPSNASIAWVGYATTAVPARIDGRDVVIQPWLGQCQKFLGMGDFPGGYGAEVGVYVRKPRGTPLPDLTGLNPVVRAALQAAHALGGENLWWPDPDCQYDLSFKVINPLTGKVMLEAQSEPGKPTYWLNKWIQPDDYERYKQDNQGQVPFASAYQMVFTVAGQQHGWHGAGPLG